MKKSLIWKFSLLGLTLLLSFVFLIPNMPFYGSLPKWWKEAMPEKAITLGLDLQGGIHLVFEVEAEKAAETTTARIAASVEEILQKKQFKADVKTEGPVILVSQNTMEIRKAIEDDYPILEAIDSPSAPLAYRLSGKEAKRIMDSAADQALETIRNRIDQFGVAEPTIQRQGANEIVVQLPGIKEPKRAIELIGKTALLEFKLVDDQPPVAAEFPSYIRPSEEEDFLKKFGPKIPADDEILFQRTVDKETGAVKKLPYLVKKKALLTGELLSDARVNIDQRMNEPNVSITFNPAGAKLFEDITGEYTQKRLAIILDNNLYSAPVIKERIGGGNAQITGNFTMQDAKDLAIVLKAGALPAPLK
ncbi:MAG: SecDF P1 head subdomain-containing protein, partial [bacterium]